LFRREFAKKKSRNNVSVSEYNESNYYCYIECPAHPAGDVVTSENVYQNLHPLQTPLSQNAVITGYLEAI